MTADDIFDLCDTELALISEALVSHVDTLKRASAVLETAGGDPNEVAAHNEGAAELTRHAFYCDEIKKKVLARREFEKSKTTATPF